MMAVPETRDGVVAKVRDHFARADANRDGFVAGDEMRGMRGQRKAQRMAHGRGARPARDARPDAPIPARCSTGSTPTATA